MPYATPAQLCCTLPCPVPIAENIPEANEEEEEISRATAAMVAEMKKKNIHCGFSRLNRLRRE